MRKQSSSVNDQLKAWLAQLHLVSAQGLAGIATLLRVPATEHEWLHAELDQVHERVRRELLQRLNDRERHERSKKELSPLVRAFDDLNNGLQGTHADALPRDDWAESLSVILGTRGLASLFPEERFHLERPELGCARRSRAEDGRGRDVAWEADAARDLARARASEALTRLAEEFARPVRTELEIKREHTGGKSALPARLVIILAAEFYRRATGCAPTPTQPSDQDSPRFFNLICLLLPALGLSEDRDDEALAKLIQRTLKGRRA